MIGRGTIPGVPTEDPGKNIGLGPGMNVAEYRELVSQNGKSRITPQNVKDLKRKVRRIR